MTTIRKAETKEEIDAAIDIQLRVFSNEQGIPEKDCHSGNEDAIHLLAFEGDAIIATARLRLQNEAEAELARVAVLPGFRGSGIGKRLVIELELIARDAGVRQLVLHPHATLEDFYSRLGYAVTSDAPYAVGRHSLITMRKLLGDLKEAG